MFLPQTNDATACLSPRTRFSSTSRHPFQSSFQFRTPRLPTSLLSASISSSSISYTVCVGKWPSIPAGCHLSLPFSIRLCIRPVWRWLSSGTLRSPNTPIRLPVRGTFFKLNDEPGTKTNRFFRNVVEIRQLRNELLRRNDSEAKRKLESDFVTREYIYKHRTDTGYKHMNIINFYYSIHSSISQSSDENYMGETVE